MLSWWQRSIIRGQPVQKKSLPTENNDALECAVAAMAAAIAEPSRVKMLCALMDGRAWTATELGAAADVAPSTASGHLAGTIAVQIYDFMLAENWLEPDGSALTVLGREQFLKLGIALNTHSRRKACCACLDWSERRFHLGGEAGAALLIFLQTKGWIQRVAGYREVAVTLVGKSAIGQHFSR